jgi:hypothetical protein
MGATESTSEPQTQTNDCVYIAGPEQGDWSPYKNKNDAQTKIELFGMNFVAKDARRLNYIVVANDGDFENQILLELQKKHDASYLSVRDFVAYLQEQENYVYVAGPDDGNWSPYKNKVDARNNLKSSGMTVVGKDAPAINYIVVANDGDFQNHVLEELRKKHDATYLSVEDLVAEYMPNEKTTSVLPHYIYLARTENDDWAPFKNKNDARVKLDKQFGGTITFVDKIFTKIHYIIIPNDMAKNTVMPIETKHKAAVFTVAEFLASFVKSS